MLGDDPEEEEEEEDEEDEAEEPELPEGQRIGDFISNEQGVFYVDVHPRGWIRGYVFICTPLRIVGITSDIDGDHWGKLCEFSDPMGLVKRHHVLSAALMTPKTVIQELIRKGLVLAAHPKAATLVGQYLRSTRSEVKMLSSVRTGWVNASFLLPEQSFGPEEILYAGDYREHGHGQAGNWEEKIGRFCPGNSRLVFAVSVSFAGPLLELANMVEGGGFHYRGESSIGKTTAQYAACSVYGNPDRYKLSCDATKGSFEIACEAHNDLTMVVDEFGLAPPATVGDIIYMLANGIGKARMSGRKRRWRALSITSGEVTLSEQMAKAGKVPMAGQEVRLLDITAEVVPNKHHAGIRMGIIEELHGFPNSKVMAEHFASATRKHYGVFGRYME